MTENKKILVTGGAGLVGRALISQLLEDGNEIIATYQNTPLPLFNNPLLTQTHCDLLDVVTLQEIMQQVGYVFHCAAIVSFHPGDQKKMYAVNVEGTANVVNAALECDVKKLVHVSSVATLGRTIDKTFVDEDAPWEEHKSSNFYSKTKYLSELEVWRGVSEGLNAAIVNPTIILGPGNWQGGSAQIFKTIYNEFAWYSEGINGFVDVRDVATAMIALMNSEISGERFILNGVNKSYQEIFELIAAGFNKKAPYKKVTPLLAKIVWRLEWIKSKITGAKPLVTKESAITALTKTFYNNEKLKKFLPDFKYTPIEDTISYTCGVFINDLEKKSV